MAVEHCEADDVLLGGGGSSPRVDRLGAEADSITEFVALSAGHSVYALAHSPYGDGLAVAGTKGGRLYWLGQPHRRADGDSPPPAEFIQGAPILSVCFAGPGQIVASDSVGRCLLWHRDNGAAPETLETGGRTVCSLLKFEESTLVGLAVNGEFLFWQLPGRQLSRAISVPAPPKWAASIHLQHWLRMEALVYPSTDGILACFLPSNEEVRCVAMHQGDFYAMLVQDDAVLTFGMHDGCMKRWNGDAHVPNAGVTIPQGIISCAALCGLSPRFLLVHHNGEAGVYTLASGKFQLSHSLPAGDYRSAAGPTWDTLRAATARQCHEEATRLAIRVQHVIERDPSVDVERDHARLSELGYKHVSLVLRAERAHRQEDLAAELSAYHQLAQILPEGEGGALRSLRRYADLLELVWQLKEAQEVYRRLASWDSTLAAKVGSLTPFVATLDSDDVVVESEVPVAVLAAAAAAVALPITSRFQIRALGPLRCREVILRPDRIIEKYDRVRQLRPQTALPEAKCAQARWIGRDRIEPADLITFHGSGCGGPEGVVFALKVMDASLETLIVPVVLFDPSTALQGRQAALMAASVVSRIGREAPTNGWIRHVHDAVKNAVNRLFTETLSMQQNGLNHGTALPRL